MKIAILGATSQIAKDLIISFSEKTDYECTMFSRDINKVVTQFSNLNIKYLNFPYNLFSQNDTYDVIINFVGIGNPIAAKKMGAKIFKVTEYYDSLVLNYLKVHSNCKYIFISSGAVFGGDFKEPVLEKTKAVFNINQLESTDWYGIAKFYAEARHRALSDLPIVDVRVFNYFSSTQSLNGGFLITDLIRAMKNNEVFITSDENIVRDFITPSDFFQLIQCVVSGKSVNLALDCYTKSPVDKVSLLNALHKQFDLKYKVEGSGLIINATGSKLNYFSKNKVAHSFGYFPFYSSLGGVLSEIKKINIPELV